MAMKPRSRPSWRSSLGQTLARLRKPDRPTRVAVLGIGNELGGDDAAGLAVARGLRELIRNRPLGPSLRIIEAGNAPENFTGTLRQFGPDLVLLIDAAQMDEAPGSVRWLAGESWAGFSGSTHTLPLDMLARYLQVEIGCEIVLIGIQPAHITAQSFPSEGSLRLSAPVGRAAAEVVSETRRALGRL